MTTKKIIIHSEFAYVFSLLILSFSVAMTAATDFGVSMIVAPAYILSLKIPAISFGQAEYIIQGILFVVFCILMKRVKLVYFSSFLTGIIYGTMLDLWRVLIPILNPEVTIPGSMSLTIKIVFFVIGMVLTALAIAIFFHIYLYPQIYDFFVKGVCEKFNLNREKFKICYDFSFLTISCIMTLIFFHAFKGIGIGTIVVTMFNGLLIGFFGRMLEKGIEFQPLFVKFSKLFDITEA